MLNKKFLIGLLALTGTQALYTAKLAFSTEGVNGVLEKAEAQKRSLDRHVAERGKFDEIFPRLYNELSQQCDQIGAWGRLLNSLSETNKQRAFAVCGDFIKNTHPKAYKAIAPKQTKSQTGTAQTGARVIENPYEELGLKASEKRYDQYTDKEIEDAYLLLSNEMQHQKNEERLRRVKEAYLLLMDKNKRTAFLESEVDFEAE